MSTGLICIGCERHEVADWLSDYKQIGEAHGLTPEQIAEYRGYIDLCAAWIDAQKKSAAHA